MRIVNCNRTRLFLIVTTLIIALSFVLDPTVSVTSRELKASPAEPLQADLTGTWTSGLRGTYYVHQVGTTVWWMGRSEDGGKSYTNVFNGTRNGDQITGFWADVPAGKNMGSGSLILSLSRTGGNLEIRKVKETGGFAEWTWKKREQPQPLNPAGVCTIFGQVKDDKPGYNTRLTLRRVDRTAPPISVRANNGEYRFTNVPEGTYEVTGVGRYPSEDTPRGPIGLGIFTNDSQTVECQPSGSHRLNFVIRSTEG